ncbi:penicillin acylase family protein [Nocardioides acrostichi]|uniref:Penicillin acylase family protein n=1 Tax=Nocardioides acrostichi TaxID=2784339 RepID=A0A930YCF5_9ACTN|nr:penicillin acylase family protein [Nocardioides acrostichi]MBF4163433.1 penicillin acylase family protein [Nocardioides acrostichi]
MTRNSSRPRTCRSLTAAAVFATAGALALAGTVGAATAREGDASRATPVAGVRNILPPGSSGNATALDVVQLGGSTTATPTTPTNFADQLELYDQLNTIEPDQIDQADLDHLFKDAGFTPDEVVSSETPTDGLTIERDSFGVPFIHGDTFEDVEYGAGYAAIEDRMFLMDVLRHTGQARMAEFVGDSPGNVAMDQEQLRTAYYTPEEADAQIQKAADRAGDDGPRLLAAVDSFVEGINAAQDALCPTVAAPSCPAEYAALQKTPEDWTRADIVYVASLVGGIFGKGGGQEAANAAWYQSLVAKLGTKRARAVYQDLREKDDQEAPVTTARRFPYGSEKFRPGLKGVAMPDADGPTGGGTGESVGGATASAPGTTTPELTLPGGQTIEVPLHTHGMSNALLVTGQHSKTGKPLAVMGPQTGYFAPQLLVEQVLDGPGIQARGVAFAGTNLFVQLGRGVDYAWSATSAGSDNVDTVVEKLCNTDGSTPTTDSTGYRDGGKCVEMDQFTHTENTTPNASSPNPPKTYEFQVLRTDHGIVQERTTVHGKPVAVVLQRSTYGHEVDSVIGFSQFNDPGYVHDAASFQQAASHIDFTFNWFYADDSDIAYYSSGLLPQRSGRTEPDLPRWGAHRFDWSGWLGDDDHVQALDPSRGYLVSWNNKPARAFTAADDAWGYGPVHRSQALENRVRAAIRGTKKVDLPQLTGIMADAATVDSRAVGTLPYLLRAIGNDKQTATARRLLRQWLRSGAHRVDRDRDGSYAHQQAIALFDTWWQDGNHAVAQDVLRGRLGNLVTKLPQALDNHPRSGQGSSWNGIAWYGYVNKDLRSVLGDKVRDGYRFGYCGNGRKALCRKQLRASLAAAVARALDEQGVESVKDLTYDKHIDDITSTAAGLVGVRPIDWQNRPTFQQVVQFESGRAR